MEKSTLKIGLMNVNIVVNVLKQNQNWKFMKEPTPGKTRTSVNVV